MRLTQLQDLVYEVSVGRKIGLGYIYEPKIRISKKGVKRMLESIVEDSTKWYKTKKYTPFINEIKYILESQNYDLESVYEKVPTIFGNDKVKIRRLDVVWNGISGVIVDDEYIEHSIGKEYDNNDYELAYDIEYEREQFGDYGLDINKLGEVM